MYDYFKEVIIYAAKKLVENDTILIDTKVKEECINHKLALYIEEKIRAEEKIDFSSLDVDLEYDKRIEQSKKVDGRPIRPDILVHQRKSGDKNNFVALEAKKDYWSRSDRRKIKKLVCENSFQYLLGCTISYLPEKAYLLIRFFQKKTNNWLEIRYNKRPYEQHSYKLREMEE